MAALTDCALSSILSPDREAADLFESSLAVLREFGRAVDAPVLVTAESADSAVTNASAPANASPSADSAGLAEYAGV